MLYTAVETQIGRSDGIGNRTSDLQIRSPTLKNVRHSNHCDLLFFLFFLYVVFEILVVVAFVTGEGVLLWGNKIDHVDEPPLNYT